MTDTDEPTYDLVYPFVVCQSNGGPYEDQAFVEGMRFGQIDAALDSGVPEHTSAVAPALVPQLDLLAMHRGYRLTTEPWPDAPDAYVIATLTRAPAPPPPPEPGAEQRDGA